MRSKRLTFLTIVLVGLAVGAGLATAAHADDSPKPAPANAAADEARFLDLANQTRASQGAPPLQIDGGLRGIARWWSGNMEGAGRIFHNRDLPQYVTDDVTPDWYEVAENVGVGPTVDDLHRAFVNSPTHYHNLVNPDLAYVGIGVVYDDNGRIYVVFDFMQLQPPPAPAPAPVPVSERPPVTVRVAPVPRAAVPAPPPPVTVPVTTPPAPVVVPPPPAPVALPQGRPLTRGAGVSVVLQQLRQMDLTVRPRKTSRPRPAPTTTVRPRPKAQTQLAPALTVQHSAVRDKAEMDAAHDAYVRSWLPPSYCEGPNKMRSRTC